MVSGYLAAERDLGRIAAGAGIGTLAPMLAGAVHLLFTGTDGPLPDGDPSAGRVRGPRQRPRLTRPA